jgi:hypothetical protein
MTDLVSLAAELHRIDLETGLDLALALRKSKRPRRQTAARKGVETRRLNERSSIGSLFNEGVQAA